MHRFCIFWGIKEIIFWYQNNDGNTAIISLYQNNDGNKAIYRVIGSREVKKFYTWFAPWCQIASIPFYEDAIEDIYKVKSQVPFSYDEKYGLKLS